MTTRWGVDYSALEDEHGLPRGLLAAVEMTESRGDPEAVSPAGATGVMQLMPRTAKDLGVDPYDPAQSIQGGARMLGRLLRQYGGNVERALQAYNFGEGNLAKGKPLPKETQQYVPRVFSRMADTDDGLESVIYGGGASAPPQTLGDDDLFSAVYGKAPQEPQGTPVPAAVTDDDLFSAVYGSAPTGRSEDVPPGVGEPGYTGNRDQDVPPGVGEPGYSPPATGRPPLSDFTNEDVIGAGWKLLPPRAQDDLGPFVRGLTAPVRADQENLAAIVPGVPQPSRVPGEQSDPRYITGNIASQVMVPGLGPATIPRAIASGVMGATMQPTTGGDYLQDKAVQAGAGGVAGGIVGALGRGVGQVAGAFKGKYADPGVDEIATLAKQHGVPLTLEDLHRARTDPTWKTRLADWVMQRAERRLEGIPLVGPTPDARHGASLRAVGREAAKYGDDVTAAREGFAQSMGAELPDWLKIRPTSSNPAALLEWTTQARKMMRPDDEVGQGLVKLVEHVANAPKATYPRETANIVAALFSLFHMPAATVAAGAGGKLAFGTEAGQRLLLAANAADDAGLAEIVQQIARMSGAASGNAVQTPATPVSDDDLFNTVYGDQQ